jgi:membrane-bound acyltransferase YfiQ involved in biofilm formation
MIWREREDNMSYIYIALLIIVPICILSIFFIKRYKIYFFIAKRHIKIDEEKEYLKHLNDQIINSKYD